ncbi:Cell division cycle protein -like protein [Toxocara canis]|uniref:Cell division cycle protein-like protein n=1 Tax=Toxocara canis TaxID=6265 RepID=A0A0B2VWT4_TOXCA|nr:Cell division cycle protein -like protein [Toxocara canis]
MNFRLWSANRSAPSVTSCSPALEAAKRKDEELDPFRESRKLAIERTIVSDFSVLPKLEDLVGLAEAKQALREALSDPLTYPEWFKSSDLKPWRCVLLYGPPGTG